MRGKKAKALRRRSDELIVEWLRGMVPEGEEADKINVNNYHGFLPEEKYYYAHGQRRNHSMTPRWVLKQLKKNPNATVAELTHGAQA